MKSKYYVINAQGKILDPEEYYRSGNFDPEFKILLEREALDIVDQKSPGVSDYLKIANKLGFAWEENSEIGFLQYGHKADLMMRLVGEYARNLVAKSGVSLYEVRGSNFFNLDYPVVQAYAGLFGDRLFQQKKDQKKLVMSYDASYPQFNLAAKAQLSESVMPFAHFSIADCYRYEKNGECMLLFRGRRFFMPDFHPYFRDLKEAYVWFIKFDQLLKLSFAQAKRKYWNIAKVSSEAHWINAQDFLSQLAKANQQPMLVEIKHERKPRYWVIDVDYSIIDQMEQVREIGCIQIDIGNAERLGIQYVDRENQAHHPVIIHAAIPGGLERYLYMILDNFNNYFPLWLAPIQVRVLLVSDKYLCDWQKLQQKRQWNLRIEVDDRSESISKKIQMVHQDFIPNFFVFGEQEVKNPDLLNQSLQKLEQEVNSMPFLKAGWPELLSKQIK